MHSKIYNLCTCVISQYSSPSVYYHAHFVNIQTNYVLKASGNHLPRYIHYEFFIDLCIQFVFVTNENKHKTCIITILGNTLLLAFTLSNSYEQVYYTTFVSKDFASITISLLCTIPQHIHNFFKKLKETYNTHKRTKDIKPISPSIYEAFNNNSSSISQNLCRKSSFEELD